MKPKTKPPSVPMVTVALPDKAWRALVAAAERAMASRTPFEFHRLRPALPEIRVAAGGKSGLTSLTLSRSDAGLLVDAALWVAQNNLGVHGAAAAGKMLNLAIGD